MSQTMHDRNELHRFNHRRLTAAGAFWLPYAFVVVLLLAYAVVS